MPALTAAKYYRILIQIKCIFPQLSKRAFNFKQLALKKNVYLRHTDTVIKRIQLKIYKRMSDKLNKYSTEVDFKGYILRWNSETAEKFVEKAQSSELNPRTSRYGKTSCSGSQISRYGRTRPTDMHSVLSCVKFYFLQP